MVPLFLFDHRFRYLAAGGKGMKYFGFSSKEIVGKKVQDAFPRNLGDPSSLL